MYEPGFARTQKDLLKNGSNIHYEVDGTKLPEYEMQLDPQYSKFDRIVWNFPHAGFPEAS
tara:strand:- start:329 stop:508 length:180 start_codon:yes stop_codon:yes gene_type:complete